MNFQSRKQLRRILYRVEKIRDTIDNPEIAELIEAGRLDLANALNLANSIRKHRIHHITKKRVLRLIQDGVTIKQISLQTGTSDYYIRQIMRSKNIWRYDVKTRIKEIAK